MNDRSIQVDQRRRSRQRLAFLGGMAALAFTGLASCTTASPSGGARTLSPEAEREALADDGRRVALAQCSSCHAIDEYQLSPRREAPPMSSLLARYDPEMLSDDLIAGIRVGHDSMPHFDFDIRETDALIAYLKSISQAPFPR